MISLVIDTCTNNVVIGLAKDTKVVDSRNEVNDKSLSTNFVVWVKELLDRNNITVNDIDVIFVAIGPGSFTGIRAGVTFAKVFAWALNKKVIPFSSLELLASTADNDVIVPLIDARRDYAFGGIYDNSLNALMEDKYILIPELLEKASKYNNPIFVSLDNFEFDTVKPDVKIEKVVQKHFNDEGINPHLLNPNYLKRTEAEENLLVKHD